jgi:hypothetical protein
MVIGTVDRIEEGILVILTHTEPEQTIHMPSILYPDLEEGDMIEISIDKNLEISQEQRDRIFQLREGLNRVEL